MPELQQLGFDLSDFGNRSLLVAGLEAGRFVELPGGGGVVYVGGMSNDGTQMSRVFVYQEDEERLDVTTAKTGRLSVDGSERYLNLEQGFRVEGPLGKGLDYRMMRYAANELRLPDGDAQAASDDPEYLGTLALLGDPRPEAKAQLHFRLAPPFLTLAFGLMAVPLARSTPRQARYGRVMMGFLAYLVGMNMVQVGTDWLETGRLAPVLGLWWLVLPLLAMAFWLYFTDGRMRRPRRARPAKVATP